jgi:N4-gp56 family major capsid protein
LSATTTNNLDLHDIDRLVAKAKTFSPMIRPIKVGGEDKWVAFLHPYQVYALRGNTSTGQYIDIQKAAMTGGQVANNPLYTGALGEYNGVILHEDVRVPPTQDNGGTGITAASSQNAYRACFAGAQAASFAVGQDNTDGAMNWVEELFDYENQLGVSAGMIFGLKKMVFNSKDFATIVATSYAPAP